jgi:hypothetical protein
MPQIFNPGCGLIHGRPASAKSISDHVTVFNTQFNPCRGSPAGQYEPHVLPFWSLMSHLI